MGNQESYNRAKRRVKAKIGFYIHLAVYIVVNIALIFINLSTSTEYYWFKWPLMGWGLGVIFHALAAFFLCGRKLITEQMIENEMKKDL